MTFPLPTNEVRRLEALRRYKLLDTAPERFFDDIAKVASQIAHTPIALMTLIDADRQWFKARVGLGIAETPREYAFCSHTIMGADPMIIEDAARDPRFAANPFVASDPHIRFYAGMPLIDRDGHALGSLCVIDQKPRHLETEHLDALQALARNIMTHVELRGVSAELASAMTNLRMLQGLLAICSHCKSIRNDEGTWEPLDHYIRSRTEAELSHGICPECLRSHYPDVWAEMRS